MSLENEYEENVDNLRKLFHVNKIVSFEIKHIQCNAGSSSGDNYMSVVKRIEISNQQQKEQDDELANEINSKASPRLSTSFIVKRQIASLSRRQLYRCDEAFYNEIAAYKHIVPLLQLYTNEIIFPKCHFAGNDDLGEIIVLEDLKALGYHMQSRLKGLNLNYCQLVMKQLAKLHAASIAAKQLDQRIFSERCKQIREIVYCKEAEEFYKNLLDTSIQESLSSLRSSNVDGSLTEPIKQIERVQAHLFQHIQNCINNVREDLRVLCHGDLWVNNIMFAISTDMSASDCALKFIDLQAMRYTSPVFDILHFFYTSTKRDLREYHTKALLEMYCHALAANLEMQFIDAGAAQLHALRDTFSLRNIMQEYYAQVLYGLAISIWVLPAVTFDPNNIPNLNAISEQHTNGKELKCTQKLTPEYHLRVKDLALEFYQNGYFDSYANEI